MRGRRAWWRAAIHLTGSILVLATPAASQVRTATEVASAPAVAYTRTERMIAMRDGVRLHVQIWRPTSGTGPVPILLSRSPYGFPTTRISQALMPGGAYGELAADRFIFVLEDLRGRFQSEGEFVNLRPQRTTPDGVDESTDTYDTIDALVKTEPGNNGKVGVFGISYGGWTAAMALIGPHPALKAVSSQASPDDMFIGDDFHHNGAFRLDYAWSWVSALETDGKTMKPFAFGTDDAYAWYLRQTDLATLDRRRLGRTMPSWQNFVDHPVYDAFWAAQRTSTRLPATVRVPNLIVAGWWDQEDFYGPLKIYAEQEKGDDRGLNYLVVGPWFHGGWRTDGAAYGPFDLGSPTGTWFRRNVELPWFRYWLKGQGTLDQPEALVFQSGSDQWQRLDHWPDRAALPVRLYLRANGRLSFHAPAAGEAGIDRYRSDPADPVPYRPRPEIKPFMADGSTWANWLADDQAPFARRKDVLFWQTAPLRKDVTVAGAIKANLFASTTGSDADWVVKLVDIYPSDNSVPAALQGRQRMIANDVLRGRFRDGMQQAKPIPPGAVIDYRVDLHSASHVFKKGHRIGVQVQSSWFPLIDRNPQTFVPNILKAHADAFRAQTHTIHHSPRYPSALTLALLPQ